MDRVMLALLGGLLLCTGIPAGQATEAGSTVEDSSPPPVLQTANYSADGATPEAPVADDYSSSPFVGDTDATSTPPTTTTEPFTSTMTTQYPYYPTTGRCGTEPRLCCLGRNDSCRRINCYCDEACYQAFSDCCSDYKAVCKNGQFTTGFGSPTTGSLAGSTLPGDTDEPTPDQFNTGFGSPTTGSLAGSTLPGDTDGPTPGPTTGNQYSSKAQPSTADTLYPTGSTTEQNGNSDCVPTEPGRKFPLLCSGQRNNLIRRCDLYGCGCYGSPRGHSLLKGVDVVCRDGATVYAPFTGTVMSLDGSYGDENDLPSGEGFMFVGSGLCLKIFNVHQDGQSGEITKGCRMGTLIPMQLKYPRITSHMHVQKCDLSDPTGLLS
ncbi:uncharacterized protein [Ambystoma mexicanum]|uniref:uncharacterized protein isoform X2 n=1 Tax=Ambystoma mexicanum TaxID=8296 RepID=UPI0037E7B51B